MFTVCLLKYRRIAEKIDGWNWVGLTDEATENKWRWVNGELVLQNQTVWKKGEPNNDKGNEDCGALDSVDALINDVPCSEVFSGICEINTVGQFADNNSNGKFNAHIFLTKILKLEFLFNSN